MAFSVSLDLIWSNQRRWGDIVTEGALIGLCVHSLPSMLQSKL